MIVNNNAKTLEEAKDFFMANSAGDITCEKENGKTKICSTYGDARYFFEQE